MKGVTIDHEDLWTSHITQFEFGKCHSLNHPETIGVNGQTESAHIYLNPALPYRMYLHDPKLFMLSGNPLVIPHIELLLKYPQNSRDTPFISIHGQYISATKHTDIDRADSPCEERTDYSFTSCVKKNITQKVGYRPQWDSEGHKDRKCTTKDQIIKHLKLHSNLSVAEQKLVIKMKGCLLPCTYTVRGVRVRSWQQRTRG